KVDALSSTVMADFSGTFTVLANIKCSGSSTGTASCDFSGTYTAIAGLQSDLDTCCLTLNSKVDALSSTVITDFDGTFTALASISSSVNFIELALNELSASSLDQIVNTFTTLVVVSNELLSTLTQLEAVAVNITTTLAALEVILTGVSSEVDIVISQLDALSATVIEEFNATFTAIAALQTDLDACCVTLNSKVDALASTVIADFAGTFTVLANIKCSGSSTGTASCDFSGTYTAIAGLQSDLDACCLTLNSKVDALSSTVIADFAGTFTVLANIKCSGSSTGTVTVDFNGTYTAIAGLQSDLDACCLTLNSKVDSLRTLVTTDFNGTFTAIAAIPAANFSGTYTALAAISALITADFNNTMTAIAGVSSLITIDFNNTMTALAACCTSIISTVTTSNPCAPIALSQTSVSNGGMLLTTTGASYCLSQNITGSIIISAADVTVDLNTHSLIGTIDILGTATNVTIKNGNVKPAAPVGSVDAAHAAVVIASTVTKTLITNCYVLCTDTATAGIIGRNGIANGGTNTIIQECFVQAGAGASGSNGGSGIVVTNNAVEIFDCTIIGGAGSVGGNAISHQGSNGKIIDNIVTGGTGTVTGGAGIAVAASTNLNIIQNCIATNCGGSGFSMLTTGTVNLLECVANYNTVHGFDLNSSGGKGLVKACVASLNLGCGFNDKVGSSYRYTANAAEGNGINPAGNPTASADSNYCFAGSPSTITVPSGPGTAPYNQWLVNTDGTFFGVSNWDNISLQ
ncbi:MAG: hypothetical protein P4M14_10210, partial [Gammaproteobacteria bacterium]|nr:hypothetical protein [Gammaproteobacteria bacterium]